MALRYPIIQKRCNKRAEISNKLGIYILLIQSWSILEWNIMVIKSISARNTM